MSALYRNHILFITVETATADKKEQILRELKAGMFVHTFVYSERTSDTCYHNLPAKFHDPQKDTYHTGIIGVFKEGNALIRSEGEKQLLAEIAATGTKGFTTHGKDDAKDARLQGLLQRGSKATLVQRVNRNVRIHHYSHALFLHGVEGPDDPKVEDKIKEMKEKFGVNEKINSA